MKRILIWEFNHLDFLAWSDSVSVSEKYETFPALNDSDSLLSYRTCFGLNGFDLVLGRELHSEKARNLNRSPDSASEIGLDLL